ncbi:hypothetical protein NPIL_548551 [Nephila pilipes]|uniref:Uncharacterized protein n=1 Tax=Nephila pilipes TaxID=299642 RepID=A0A8X6PFP6_NEPPI|nr:hypothetical protein NPIL_548551 [Nephila pilipes]
MLARISFGYRINLHIYKRGSVMARDEALNSPIRLHAAAVGCVFVLMDDNVHSQIAVIISDYLEAKGVVAGGLS